MGVETKPQKYVFVFDQAGTLGKFGFTLIALKRLDPFVGKYVVMHGRFVADSCVAPTALKRLFTGVYLTC